MSKAGYDMETELDMPKEQSELGRKAWKAASRAAKHMSKHSKIVDPKLEKCIPRFESSEIVIGDLLGSGGFNNVFQLERIELVRNPLEAPHARKICSDLQQAHRHFVSQHVYRVSSRSSRYAVKFLSHETIADEDRFCTGAADLVIEAKFLASLNHPNIIRLRGMAAAGTSGFSTCQEQGYFLILDRLQCTLDDRIEDWREQLATSPKRNQHLLADRLHVAFDVAAALNYLHQNDIIYRDLKPDNIGFDIRGDVKLFDFGLAKELDESLRCGEFYELSGNTGSLRYMAPEVALSETYNLSADVYSFGLLLWQVCSLELPYDGMSRADHSKYVVKGEERPVLDPSWSTPVRILMKRAWEPDPTLRPTMDSIYKILKREITTLRDGDATGLENVRRRSTFVLNRDSAANPGRRNSLSRTASMAAGIARTNSMRRSIERDNSKRMLMQSRSQSMLRLINDRPQKSGAQAA
eukprot:CAMPEP_0116838156 /NCGR_PEP_ID=MMETSP0418-20121206/9055_1 /TAXON_ID=1158023 /ORGANISM="Astrosyne radiata, Strain 13vi08-1A" /LENGTH=466 /DNA_ID=CAMNT_0004468125 /DNA_START=114 /DNA_END=1514 /DNA_ORIENTATION=-